MMIDTASSAVLTVGPNSKACGAVACNFVRDLNKALSSANAGDEIAVYDTVEVTCEDDADSYLFVDKPVRIKGALVTSVIRAMHGKHCAKQSFITIASSDVKIEDVRLAVERADNVTTATTTGLVIIDIDGRQSATFGQHVESTSSLLSRYAKPSAVKLQQKRTDEEVSRAQQQQQQQSLQQLLQGIEIVRVKFPSSHEDTAIYVRDGKHFDLKIESNEFIGAPPSSSTDVPQWTIIRVAENARINAAHINHNAFVNGRVVVLSPREGRRADIIDMTYNYWNPLPFSDASYRENPTHLISGLAITVPYCADQSCDTAGPISDQADHRIGYASLQDYKTAYSAGKTASQKIGVEPVITFVARHFVTESTFVVDFPVTITSSANTHLHVTGIENAPAFSVISNAASFSNLNVSIESPSAGFAWFRPERALSVDDMESLGDNVLSQDARGALKKGSPLRAPFGERNATVTGVTISGSHDTHGIIAFSASRGMSLQVSSCVFEKLGLAIFTRWPILTVEQNMFSQCDRGIIANVAPTVAVGKDTPLLKIHRNVFSDAKIAGVSVFDSNRCAVRQEQQQPEPEPVIESSPISIRDETVQMELLLQENVFIDALVSISHVRSFSDVPVGAVTGTSSSSSSGKGNRNQEVLERGKSVLIDNNSFVRGFEGIHEIAEIDKSRVLPHLPSRGVNDRPDVAQSCLMLHGGVYGAQSSSNTYRNCHVFLSSHAYHSQDDQVKDESVVYVMRPKTSNQCFAVGGDMAFDDISFDLPVDNINIDASLFERLSIGIWDKATLNAGYVVAYDADRRVDIDSVPFLYLVETNLGAADATRFIGSRINFTACLESDFSDVVIFDLRDSTEIKNHHQSLRLLDFGEYLTESGSVSSCGTESGVPLKFSRETCECLPLARNEIYHQGAYVAFVEIAPLVIETLDEDTFADDTHTGVLASKGRRGVSSAKNVPARKKTPAAVQQQRPTNAAAENAKKPAIEKKVVSKQQQSTTSRQPVKAHEDRALSSSRLNNRATAAATTTVVTAVQNAKSKQALPVGAKQHKRSAYKRNYYADDDENDGDDDDDDDDYNHHSSGVVLWLLFGFIGLVLVLAIVAAVSWNSYPPSRHDVYVAPSVSTFSAQPYSTVSPLAQARSRFTGTARKDVAAK